MEEQLTIIFRNQLAKIRKAIKAVKDGTKLEDSHDFSLPNFWLHFTIAVDTLSNSVTRLAFVLTKPPLPEVKCIKDLALEIEKAYTNIVHAFKSLPQSKGAMLCRAVGNTTNSILTGVEHYFSSCLKNPSDPSQAELVGIIWRTCETIPDLPKDNKAAVEQILENEDDLMKDAVEELEDELKLQRSMRKSGVVIPEAEKWSDAEYKLVEAALVLVRTTRAAAKRTLHSLKSNAAIDSPEQISDLDILGNIVELFSPLLDDFISSVYPPVDIGPLPGQLEQLVSTLKTLMDLLNKCHFIKPPDQTWISHLRKDLGENESNIQGLISCEEILELANLSID